MEIIVVCKSTHQAPKGLKLLHAHTRANNGCRLRIPVDVTSLNILFYLHERRAFIRLRRYEIKKKSPFRPKGVISVLSEAKSL
jgi:hypothetical protein